MLENSSNPAVDALIAAYWPRILALPDKADPGRLVVLAEPWRLLGSSFAASDGETLALVTMTDGEFLNLPAALGNYAGAALILSVAHENAGEHGFVFAYLGTDTQQIKASKYVPNRVEDLPAHRLSTVPLAFPFGASPRAIA